MLDQLNRNLAQISSLNSTQRYVVDYLIQFVIIKITITLTNNVGIKKKDVKVRYKTEKKCDYTQSKLFALKQKPY